MRPPADDTWVALTGEPLPVGAVAEWAQRRDCGAQVLFTGTVRDASDDRPGVSSLEYEAYTEQVEPALAAITREARRQWPEIARVALLHRSGVLGVGEPSVVVAVAAAHRGPAFAAARFCIDTLKASVPIWKKETWEGGHDWAGATAVHAPAHRREAARS